MEQEAVFLLWEKVGGDGAHVSIRKLMLFAAEVEKEEREACAAECERMVMYPGGRQESAAHNTVWDAAKAIRKRSNVELCGERSESERTQG